MLTMPPDWNLCIALPDLLESLQFRLTSEKAGTITWMTVIIQQTRGIIIFRADRNELQAPSTILHAFSLQKLVCQSS
jgi:hypothetical protein